MNRTILVRMKMFCRHEYKNLFVALSFTSAVFVVYFTFFSVSVYDQSFPFQSILSSYDARHLGLNGETSKEAIKPANAKSHVEPELKCHLPKLKPFDDSIMEYVEEPDSFKCPKKEFPLLFTTHSSHLLLIDNPMKYGYVKCFYRYFTRKHQDDDNVVFSKKRYPIIEMSTKIPRKHEFIAVNCSDGKTSKIIDMFPLVPFKFRKEENKLWEEGYNVVILGIDAVSHMNFIRVMPKSYKFLTEDMKAIGMNGYTKIGDNTFPNVAAALMGMNQSELEKGCLYDSDQYFDDCPFIWKNYSSLGYATSYSEDAAWMSALNYGKNGFLDPPTDYYTRPFFYTSEEIVGSERPSNAFLCHGPRLTFEVILNYLQQTAITMQSNKKKYFQFIWATSLFHDYLNEGRLGDQALLNTLNMMTRKGFLENTILILTSDHGARWGDIRNTYQGRIEERMPFLYFSLPAALSNNSVYSQALENMKINKERLTTPYDLHETLKDFLNIENLENQTVIAKTEALRKMKIKPRGISLFQPIPPERDCPSAGIEEHWCVCHAMKNVPVENNVDVKEAAEQAVAFINKILAENDDAHLCANLSLYKVLTAQEMKLNTTALQADKEDEEEEKDNKTKENDETRLDEDTNDDNGHVDNDQKDQNIENVENNENANSELHEKKDQKDDTVNDDENGNNTDNKNPAANENNQVIENPDTGNNRENVNPDNEDREDKNPEIENNHEIENPDNEILENESPQNKNKQENDNPDNEGQNNENLEIENNQENVNPDNGNIQDNVDPDNKDNRESGFNENQDIENKQENDNPDNEAQNNENPEIENNQENANPDVENIQDNVDLDNKDNRESGFNENLDNENKQENDQDNVNGENVNPDNENQENENPDDGNDQEKQNSDNKENIPANENFVNDQELEILNNDHNQEGEHPDFNENDIGNDNPDNREIQLENNESNIMKNENNPEKLNDENNGDNQLDDLNNGKNKNSIHKISKRSAKNDKGAGEDQEDNDPKKNNEIDQNDEASDNEDEDDTESYSSELIFSVNFITSPGNASFEATIKRSSIKDGYIWSILGDVSRTNLYGNQSSCVDTYKIKKFCYCM